MIKKCTNLNLNQEPLFKRTEQEAFKDLVYYLTIRDSKTVHLRLNDLTDVIQQIKKEFNL